MRFVEKNESNLVLERVQDGQSWPYILKDPNGAMMNIETPDTQNADKSVGIADVVEVKVEASAPFEQYWFTQAATTEGQVGTNNHNSTSCIVKYAQPVQFDKFKIYGNEGITFTITITKSDGTVLMHSPEIKSEPQEILQINNEINDGKIEIPVRKVWSGDDAFAAIRPEITVNLYHYIADSEISDRADLEQYAIEENKVGTVILGGNKWEHTFTGVTPSYEENGEIKQYFFFDGEQLYNYFGKGQDTTHVKDSIHEIAQISIITKCRENLEKILDEYRKSIAKLLPKGEGIADEISKKRDEKAKLDSDIMELEESIAQSEDTIETLNQNINGLDHLVEDNARYNANNTELTKLEEEKKKLNAELRAFVRKYFILLMMYDMEVPLNYSGFRYLKFAVLIAFRNPSQIVLKEIYQ